MTNFGKANSFLCGSTGSLHLLVKGELHKNHNSIYKRALKFLTPAYLQGTENV